MISVQGSSLRTGSYSLHATTQDGIESALFSYPLLFGWRWLARPNLLFCSTGPVERQSNDQIILLSLAISPAFEAYGLTLEADQVSCSPLVHSEQKAPSK